jgi:hypothetical protein
MAWGGGERGHRTSDLGWGELIVARTIDMVLGSWYGLALRAGQDHVFLRGDKQPTDPLQDLPAHHA